MSHRWEFSWINLLAKYRFNEKRGYYNSYELAILYYYIHSIVFDIVYNKFPFCEQAKAIFHIKHVSTS